MLSRSNGDFTSYTYTQVSTSNAHANSLVRFTSNESRDSVLMEINDRLSWTKSDRFFIPLTTCVYTVRVKNTTRTSVLLEPTTKLT